MLHQLLWQYLVCSRGTATAPQIRRLHREVRFVGGLLLCCVALGALLAGPASMAGVSAGATRSAAGTISSSGSTAGGPHEVVDCNATAPSITDPLAIQFLAAVSDDYTNEELDAGLNAALAFSGLPTDPGSLEWAGLSGDRCADVQKVLATPPAVTLAAQTGVDPTSLLIFDNDANPTLGGPPVAIVTPLTSQPIPVDAHSCFSLGLVEILGPNGNAQVIAGIVEGVDPWGQARSMSVPLIDLSMLQKADPDLLPPLELGLRSPEKWWAGLLDAFTEVEGESGGCLLRCWECDTVCAANSSGVVCLAVDACPDDDWADARYRALEKKRAASIEEAWLAFLQNALLISIGAVTCAATVFGLGCVGAAITKAGQTLTPILLGPVAGGASAGGAASVGGFVGLTALALLGVLAFTAATGMLSLILGAAAIAGCIAASLVTLGYAHAAYLAAVEKANAEFAADLASLLGQLCGCDQTGYHPPALSCIGKHHGQPVGGDTGALP